MKRSWTVAVALLGSLALASPAHAFMLDGFGDDQVEVVRSTVGSTTGPAIAVTDTDLINASRTLTAEKTNGPNEVSSSVNDSQYFYSQDSQTFGTGRVDWTGFDPISLNQGLNILVNITEADQTGGSLALTLGSGGVEETVSVAIPQVTLGSPVSEVFALTGYSASTLASVDSASLSIDGSAVSSLDVSVDFIEVPAPGVLGLLGIGLAGIAFAARRRRTTQPTAA